MTVHSGGSGRRRPGAASAGRAGKTVGIAKAAKTVEGSGNGKGARGGRAAAPAAIVIESRIEDSDRVEWRREQIVQAAVACFARAGYHGTTIKDIADSAGFSAGLIYSYVKDKEDVLFLVYLHIFETYQRHIPERLLGTADPLQRLCTAVRAYCEAVDLNVGATVVGYRESASLRPELRRAIQRLELETNRLVAEPIEVCIAAGLVEPTNVELLTFRLVLLAHGWALKHWHFAGRVTLADYIDDGLRLYLEGMLTPAGRRRRRVQQARAQKAAVQRRPVPGSKR
jgi:AcrR family transcriptional regulator